MARKLKCECGDCRTCQGREQMRRWRAAHPEWALELSRRSKESNRERARERDRAYYQTNREEVGRRKREYRKRNAEKISARAAVNNGVQRGRLERPDRCTRCGARDAGIEAHHPDYSRPLDVVWLCPLCHGQEHRKAA